MCQSVDLFVFVWLRVFSHNTFLKINNHLTPSRPVINCRKMLQRTLLFIPSFERVKEANRHVTDDAFTLFICYLFAFM